MAADDFIDTRKTSTSTQLFPEFPRDPDDREINKLCAAMIAMGIADPKITDFQAIESLQRQNELLSGK